MESEIDSLEDIQSKYFIVLLLCYNIILYKNFIKWKKLNILLNY